jgi:arylformamidase
MAGEFKLIDVSHSIEDGMITYKGLPAPAITDHLTRSDSRNVYAEGTEFHIGKIEMVANTGTYLDTPFHRYARGKDLAQLDLYSVANLEGIVIHCAGREIGPAVFDGVDLEEKPSCFTPAGTSIGAPKNTGAAIIRFSPLTARRI